MNSFKTKLRVGLLPVALVSSFAHASPIADFEDLTLAPNSAESGASLSGSFQSHGFSFNNSYTDWGGGVSSWAGFAYSNQTDTTTAGYGNQFSSIAGSGVNGSSNFGVGYVDAFGGVVPTISAPASHGIGGLYVTNTTYAALSMEQGDWVAKKFGGASGNDPDWFLLTATGWKAGLSTGTAEFYLADYRFTDNSKDYIVQNWRWFDLSSLGDPTQVTFSLSSSDNGLYGMNTPAYFAIDNVQSAPEPSALAALGLGLVGLLRVRKGAQK